MKYLILCLFLLFVPKLSAASPTFGLGVVVAGPTGITGEYIYGKDRDVSASLGWGDHSFHLNLDHHWNRSDMVKVDGRGINVYLGLGLRWLNWDTDYRDRDSDSEIGVRVPVGVQHIFRQVPIQIFFELAPAIILVDHTAFIIDIAIGARYFF